MAPSYGICGYKRRHIPEENRKFKGTARETSITITEFYFSHVNDHTTETEDALLKLILLVGNGSSPLDLKRL